MNQTAEKKNVLKLQLTVVDALEDVKAQNLVVYDTEHLSSLFERVIIASGTSNRQTKALAASVRDKVREAGFGKPRIEGEDNGEWIIVDCGPVVAHIMQPMIREYYHLEDIWGEKPIKSKAEKSAAKAKTAAAKKASAGKKSEASEAKPAKAPAAKKTPAKPKTTVAGSAVKTTAKKVTAKKAVAKKAVATKKVASTAVAKKTSVAKPAAKKAPAKKAPAKSTRTKA